MDYEFLFVPASRITIANGVDVSIIHNIVWRTLKPLELSDMALRLAVIMSPVIGYRDVQKKIQACGNLRALYVVRELGLDSEIPVVLLPRESITNPRVFALQTTLISLLTQGLDETYAPGTLFQLWSELGSKNDRVALSRRFANKTQFAAATCQNRRSLSTQLKQFESSFLAMREHDGE